MQIIAFQMQVIAFYFLTQDLLTKQVNFFIMVVPCCLVVH